MGNKNKGFYRVLGAFLLFLIVFGDFGQFTPLQIPVRKIPAVQRLKCEFSKKIPCRSYRMMNCMNEHSRDAICRKFRVEATV